jgi:hypothetical protein
MPYPTSPDQGFPYPNSNSNLYPSPQPTTATSPYPGGTNPSYAPYPGGHAPPNGIYQVGPNANTSPYPSSVHSGPTTPYPSSPYDESKILQNNEGKFGSGLLKKTISSGSYQSELSH